VAITNRTTNQKKMVAEIDQVEAQREERETRQAIEYTNAEGVRMAAVTDGLGCFAFRAHRYDTGSILIGLTSAGEQS
jgi:hypothetical protein